MSCSWVVIAFVWCLRTPWVWNSWESDFCTFDARNIKITSFWYWELSLQLECNYIAENFQFRFGNAENARENAFTFRFTKKYQVRNTFMGLTVTQASRQCWPVVSFTKLFGVVWRLLLGLSKFTALLLRSSHFGYTALGYLRALVPPSKGLLVFKLFHWEYQGDYTTTTTTALTTSHKMYSIFAFSQTSSP